MPKYLGPLLFHSAQEAFHTLTLQQKLSSYQELLNFMHTDGVFGIELLGLFFR